MANDEAGEMAEDTHVIDSTELDDAAREARNDQILAPLYRPASAVDAVRCALP